MQVVVLVVLETTAEHMHLEALTVVVDRAVTLLVHHYSKAAKMELQTPVAVEVVGVA
jgi:hypothetical protein